MKINLSLACLLVAFSAIYASQAIAQNCGPANTIYGVKNSDQRMLVTIDTATGATTDIGDIFGGGNAATDPTPQTSAIAVDPTTGIIWFATRAPGNIYSYTPGAANPYGTTTAAFGFSDAINKAAYNPADGNIYFHVGGNSTNKLYKFNPATPNTAPVLVGSLGIAGGSSPLPNFGGGDIAFDGLGNLTGVFTFLNALAAFPAIYDANGTYQGVNPGQGVRLASFSTFLNAVAFLPGGDYLVSGNTSVMRVNTNTGTQTTLSSSVTSDFASCATPVPNITVRQTAASSCTGVNQITLTFTIKVQNTGKFAAINTRLFDQVPAGLTVTGATLNGTAIPGANNALFNTGNGPLISSTGAAVFQSGVLERGDSATIVLTATAVPGMYSNQAGVSYTGVETLNLPNDRIASDNPATTAANDATVITGGCSSLAGTVFNDANGMNNSAVDGAGTGIADGTQLYLNLVNGSGVVVATVPVNSNGTYSMPNIPDGSFTAQLSSMQGEVGQTAPLQTLPAGWEPAGESFAGVNDTAIGNGLTLTVNGNSTDANFGIERLPESYPVTETQTGMPAVTSLGSNPLQGSDPEDQPAQGSWTGKTLVIDTLPTNDYLLTYNSTAVAAGTQISNYDPALLSIEPGSGSAGTATSTFQYSTVDAAGKKDPSPASYTVDWSIPLSAALLSFSGSTAACAVDIAWLTGKEDQLQHFAVQRSTDGRSYETIAVVAPQGSNSRYSYRDEQAGEGAGYYRLEIVDAVKSVTYSLVLSFKTNCPAQSLISIYPNPATDKVNIEGLDAAETEIRLYTSKGRLVKQQTVKATKTVLNLSGLANGLYRLLITGGGSRKSFNLIKR